MTLYQEHPFRLTDWWTMQNIQSKQEYYELVEELYLEFQETINDGFARSIANQVIAGFKIIDGSPVVYLCADYEGEPIEALGGRLKPFDVLCYTTVDRLPEAIGSEPESAIIRAQEALTLDLLDLAYADRDGEVK